MCPVCFNVADKVVGERYTSITMMTKRGSGIVQLLGVLTPSAYIYAQNTGWVDAVVTGMGGLIGNVIIPTLAVIAIALFLWGAVLFIAQAGNETARAAGKQKMMWGVAGLFILITVWGIVALITEIAGVGPATSITAPGFTM
jgi:Type IV secretion system pilin